MFENFQKFEVPLAEKFEILNTSKSDSLACSSVLEDLGLP